MAGRVWSKIDKVMRWAHSYTGLFLGPWFLVYGASALLLNHNAWIVKHLPPPAAKWEVVKEEAFTPNDTFPHERAAAAEAILEKVGLTGAHRVLPASNQNQLIILRPCGSGNYRVTWMRRASTIKVEQLRPFVLRRLVHFLHFKAGYGQHYVVHVIWAVIVDLVAVSMWLWVFSGVYLWARRSRRRLIGFAVCGGGVAAFVILVIMLCL